MPKTLTPQDLGDAVNKLFKQIADLQQQVTRPDVMGAAPSLPDNPTFTSVTVNGYLLDTSITDVDPTTITLTPGSYMDDIFIDVSWAAPAHAAEYEILLLRQTTPGNFVLEDSQRIGGTSIRFSYLAANTTYGVQVTSINALGIRGNAQPVPPKTAVTGADTTVPPVVTNVTVGRGATTVVVKFTPLTYAQAPDVVNGRGTYDIQISTDPAFGTIVAEVFSGDQIVGFNDIITQGTYYARVRAVDDSGNVGAWSTVAGPATAGGVIDSMIVAGLDAAKITVGFLSASRIQAGSLTADKLTSSSLTTANITLAGGSFKVNNPPTNGLIIDSQGIRGYAAGVVKFSVDQNGTAIFTGTVSASILQSSWFQWAGGGVYDNYGLYLLTAQTGYVLNRSIYWQQETSPYTIFWRMYSPNASQFVLERTNVQTGQYSELDFGADRIYLKSYNGTLMGYFYWNSNTYPSGYGLSVGGAFNAPSKSFIIDHPLDPDHKLLHHACIEGPEFGVYYRGKAKLVNGVATVELPDYFEALVYEEWRTVSLTPIFIDKKTKIPVLASSYPKDGKFLVYDTEGKSNGEFFWVVMAERKDLDHLTTEYDKEELAGADVHMLLSQGQDIPEHELLTGAPHRNGFAKVV